MAARAGEGLLSGRTAVSRGPVLARALAHGRRPDVRARWVRTLQGHGGVGNGRIHGRETSDSKGPLLTQLAGLESHLAVAGRLPVNVRVWLEAEEEIGSGRIAVPGSYPRVRPPNTREGRRLAASRPGWCSAGAPTQRWHHRGGG